ncbi:MAG: DUF305 domain-containing protein [Bacteroidota bacterium]
MKRQHFFTAASIFALFALSCSKNENGLKLQAHNENRMMDSMHSMMARMEAMTPTNDPEVDFVKMMIMHHQGAINMAGIELQSGTSDTLKKTAQKIITAQQMEIQQLNLILASLSNDNTDPSFTAEQKENMMKGAKVADIQVITGDIDNDFATLMIVHHQGALDNASAYLHHGNHSQLKQIATNIMSSQPKEIQELSNWLVSNRR